MSAETTTQASNTNIPRYILQGTGSFAGALVYVGANAAVAIACYLFIVGDIKRVSLSKSLIR